MKNRKFKQCCLYFAPWVWDKRDQLLQCPTILVYLYFGPVDNQSLRPNGPFQLSPINTRNFMISYILNSKCLPRSPVTLLYHNLFSPYLYLPFFSSLLCLWNLKEILRKKQRADQNRRKGHKLSPLRNKLSETHLDAERKNTTADGCWKNRRQRQRSLTACK